jgi:hypothetical protein
MQDKAQNCKVNKEIETDLEEEEQESLVIQR